MRKCQQLFPRCFSQPSASWKIWSWQSALLIDLPLRGLQEHYLDQAHRPVVDSSRCNGMVDAEELGVGGEVVVIKANSG